MKNFKENPGCVDKFEWIDSWIIESKIGSILQPSFLNQNKNVLNEIEGKQFTGKNS